MRKYIIVVVSIFTFIASYAQKNPKVYDELAKKNFYLLYAIQNNEDIKNLLAADPSFVHIISKQKKGISRSFESSNDHLDILIDPYLISREDSKKIIENLYRIYKKSRKFKTFIEDDIRKSGVYFLFDQQKEKEFIESIWNLNAEGINNILKVYGTGKQPRYANIDSVSYNVNSKFYKNSIKMWSMHNYSEITEKSNWFEPSFNFALSLLYLNHRDEAARYEPIEEKENSKTALNIENMDFDNFQYGSILILGNGPENYRDRLSALGKLNIKLGVKEYNEGKAPIIVVSGGHAHPFRAEFCEAMEMKKELINEYNIPENRIIIEPHARHTTTNLRNASRLYYKYGIPIKKLHLVITNNNHSNYLTSEQFPNRCLEELGYLPSIIKNRINTTAVEFLPQKKSLQQNPLEPLDP